jgi:ABC-type multidrug transport system ATPase subunit
VSAPGPDTPRAPVPAPGPPAPAIALDGVSKWYPTRHGRKYVLRDVTVRLPAGRHLALLGANGAGKTTLLRLIGGIDHPSAGAIRSRARISWPVGLTGGFQGSLTGRENARFVCRINGIAERPALRERLGYVADFAGIRRGDERRRPGVPREMPGRARGAARPQHLHRRLAQPQFRAAALRDGGGGA